MLDTVQQCQHRMTAAAENKLNNCRKESKIGAELVLNGLERVQNTNGENPFAQETLAECLRLDCQQASSSVQK